LIEKGVGRCKRRIIGGQSETNLNGVNGRVGIGRPGMQGRVQRDAGNAVVAIGNDIYYHLRIAVARRCDPDAAAEMILASTHCQTMAIAC
jgi:hypothetical protein